MKIGKLIQSNNVLEVELFLCGTQFSGDVQMDVQMSDETFKDCTVGFIVSYKDTEIRTVELSHSEDNSVITIPYSVLKKEGYIYLSMYGLKGETTITTSLVSICISKSNTLDTDNMPNEAQWQQLATQLVQQYIVTNVDHQIKALTDEATRQQTVAVEQQTTATEQQTEVTRLQLAVDTAIQSMNDKLDDGTFIPEHKWENTTLFFKHSDGTWDTGVNLAMPDASVTEEKLANGSVTTEKIADLSVTRDKLADKIMVFVSDNTDGSITVDIPTE